MASTLRTWCPGAQPGMRTDCHLEPSRALTTKARDSTAELSGHVHQLMSHQGQTCTDSSVRAEGLKFDLSKSGYIFSG